MTYTIQVSNHREAGLRIPTQAASESWETKWDGPIESAPAARRAVEDLSQFYRHVRMFGGRYVGKVYYAVLR